MTSQRIYGLLLFSILLSSVPALPMMGDVDQSEEMTTTTPAPQEISTTIVERSESTSRPLGDNSYVPSTNSVTTTVSTELGSVTDVKTMEPVTTTTTVTPPTVPSVVELTTLVDTPTTSVGMKHPATESIPMKQPVDSNSIVHPETTVTAVVVPVTLPLETTAMATIDLDKNEILKPSDEGTIPLAIPTMGAEPAGFESLFNFDINKLDENAIGEGDNVLTMSSNEDTTRIDSKTESIDSQIVAADVDPPKPQETKTEVDPKGGKSGGTTIIATNVVALTVAVMFVIV